MGAIQVYGRHTPPEQVAKLLSPSMKGNDEPMVRHLFSSNNLPNLLLSKVRKIVIHSFTALAVVASFALIKGDEWRDGVTNTYPEVRIDDSARKAPAPISMRDLVILFANENYGQSNAKAFIEIIYRESRFQHDAENSSSGAYGLGQALPPEKMSIIDDDWKTNPMTQLRWVARYIKERYETPLNALAHHDDEGWY